MTRHPQLPRSLALRSRRFRDVLLVALALSLGLAGCASGGRSNEERIAGATADRIVLAELQALEQIDAYRAIERLRPRWLRARGSAVAGEPVFYVDGVRRGTLRDMRSFEISQIERMEYLSAADASTRFGTGHQAGVILVTTRR